MPRTEVYQLRLTSKEKEILALKARGRRLSVAAMIRRDYGLDDAAVVEAVRAYVDNRGNAATVEPESISAARLVQRLKNQGYTTPVAERMAREQLS